MRSAVAQHTVKSRSRPAQVELLKEAAAQTALALVHLRSRRLATLRATRCCHTCTY